MTKSASDQARPEVGKVHTFRVPDRIWNSAMDRAYSEGYSLNRVVNEFLEGYSKNLLNLPEKIYTPFQGTDDN